MSQEAQARCDDLQPRLVAAEKELLGVYREIAAASRECGVSDTLLRAMRVSMGAVRLNMKTVHNTLELAAEDAGATPQSGGQDKDLEDEEGGE